MLAYKADVAVEVIDVCYRNPLTHKYKSSFGQSVSLSLAHEPGEADPERRTCVLAVIQQLPWWARSRAWTQTLFVRCSVQQDMSLIVWGLKALVNYNTPKKIRWNTLSLYYECAATGKLPVASSQAVAALGGSSCQVLLLVQLCAVPRVEIASLLF